MRLRRVRCMRFNWVGLMLVLAGCVWLGGTSAWACPNCREALAGDPVQAGLVRGFFWSILFMLSMPFLILGGLGSYFYWEVRRAQRAAAANGAGSVARAEDPGSPFSELEFGGASRGADALDACRS